MWLVISIVVVPVGTFTVSKGWFTVEVLQITIEAATVIFYFVLGFYGFRQTTVFTNLELSATSDQQSTRASYERSGLAPAQAKEHHARLLALMETSRPFLNGELTAAALSDQMGISVNHLSQVLNMEQHQNFFDFVNGYRVREVIAKMKDGKNGHLTLLAIGLDSGFNSKTSFNSVFKKHTNKTRSQYQKTLT
jgi:AraC-like DNA-binding protein